MDARILPPQNQTLRAERVKRINQGNLTLGGVTYLIITADELDQAVSIV